MIRSVCVFARACARVCVCVLKGRAGSYLVLVIIKRHHVHHQYILDFGVQPHHCDSAAGKHASEEIDMTGKNKIGLKPLTQFASLTPI